MDRKSGAVFLGAGAGYGVGVGTGRGDAGGIRGLDSVASAGASTTWRR